MVHHITQHNSYRHRDLLAAMHADRKRVFVDRLKWDIPHDGILERDEFDDDHAEYLIVSDPETGGHCASLRLLRTERPHILADLFPTLCDRHVPCGPDIREITRMCLSPDLRRSDRVHARNLLARALVDLALAHDIRAYTGVAEPGWFAKILEAGWHSYPLGLPRMVAGEMLGALIIHINSHTPASLLPDWRIVGADTPRLRMPMLAA